ncbi:MAG: ABC transporter ATP-binding protein [Candidatus Mcinerneyibacterium aminivorans]|uniref:ABC transporter ATP-binding protein n=1 Tax=Candidatus Mcinerneyibacterium aminivorans TaxID=2703815 RepID=A0A5D0MIZ6_9BACT|nr:MAG: ABC transporter ATP-binding protein [Candidatus Mcinerneyibacterium aminivorans]
MRKKTSIKIKNVSKNYGEETALKNVSFEVKKGEILGYIGPNGAGKTTTMKIILNLIKDYDGNVQINGKEYYNDKLDIYKKIGYLPQNMSFHKWRTVYDTLVLLGKLSNIDSKYLNTRIEEVLAKLNLINKKNKKIKSLSGGMVQKVGVAQAILHKPEILVLDEPFNGLDPESRYKVKNILTDLKEIGTTIIFSSHILSDIEELTDFIAILDEGKLKYCGNISKLYKKVEKENGVRVNLSYNPINTNDNNIPLKYGIKNYYLYKNNSFVLEFSKNSQYNEAINYFIKELLKRKCKIKSIIPEVWNLETLYNKTINRG